MFSLIEVWKGSGKTQRGFCKEKEIAYSRFQYWLRKYNEDQPTGNESSPRFVAIPVSVNPSAARVPEFPVPGRCVCPSM